MIESPTKALDAPRNPSIAVEEVAAAIRASTKAQDLDAGKRAHARILASALKNNRYLANLLIDMYGRCGDPVSAKVVFDSIESPNVFSWTLLLTTYAINGHVTYASSLFDAMPERCSITWNTMIAVYAQIGNMPEAAALFGNMPQPDVVSWTTLLLAYTVSGHLDWAERVFHNMPCWNSQSWNILIGAFVRSGNTQAVEKIFFEMPQPDIVSWNYLLVAYTQSGYHAKAQSMFEHMPARDVASWTTMVTAYSQHGSVDQAREIFDEMPEWNIIASNALIAAFSQRGLAGESKRFFDSLLERDIFSWNSMLAAMAAIARPRQAREVFDAMPEHDVISWNTMIAAYGYSAQHLEDARTLFDSMPARDIISWNSMIAACASSGRGHEALDLFVAIDPQSRDEATLGSAIEACGNLASLVGGAAIHAEVARTRSSSTILGNALIHMYAKCGCIDLAARVFDRMWRRDHISWSSIISALDHNGESARALAFLPIISLYGELANEITLTSILSACSHIGSIDAAFQCFISLGLDYSVEHRMEHYACIVDLLGRSGWLPEAEELIRTMPYEPDPVAVASLLAACKLQGDGLRAVRLHNIAISAGALVLLSDMAAGVAPRHEPR